MRATTRSCCAFSSASSMRPSAIASRNEPSRSAYWPMSGVFDDSSSQSVRPLPFVSFCVLMDCNLASGDLVLARSFFDQPPDRRHPLLELGPPVGLGDPRPPLLGQ